MPDMDSKNASVKLILRVESVKGIAEKSASTNHVEPVSKNACRAFMLNSLPALPKTSAPPKKAVMMMQMKKTRQSLLPRYKSASIGKTCPRARTRSKMPFT